MSVGIGKGGGGGTESAGVDADKDEVRGDFYDGVVGAREAVEGGVGAEEGGPGGPEFVVELRLQPRTSEANASRVAKQWNDLRCATRLTSEEMSAKKERRISDRFHRAQYRSTQ